MKKRALRKIFGSKEEKTWVCGQYMMRNCVICIRHQILFGNQAKKNQKGRVCGMWGGGVRYW